MPRGGKRLGAGRPHGSRDAIWPRPALRALKTISPTGTRVPATATEEERAAADHAFQRIVDVMCEKVRPDMASPVLKASAMVREEICGPIVKKMEVKASLESVLNEALADDP